MFLSKYQKDLINKFEKGVITDIYSFLISLEEISKCEYEGPKFSFYLDNINEQLFDVKNAIPNIIYIYDENSFELIKDKLFEFLFLTRYLEEQRLIRAVRLSPGGNCFFTPVIPEKNKDNIKLENLHSIINQLVFEGYNYRFEVSPAIKEFINRGYLSDQDHKYKKSSKWTKIVAGIAFLGVVANTVIQVVYSGKERDVNINNRNAFPESTKVILVNPLNNKVDTLKDIKIR